MFRLCSAILLLAAVCSAQDTGPSEQETIRLLLQQVKELQEKVKALEAQQATPATPVGQAPPAPPAEPAAQNPAPETALAPLPHDLHGIHWLGFAEADYKVLDQRKPELGTFGFNPGSAGNFFIGDFDLFLTSQINDKSEVFSEIVIGEDENQTFDVALERMILKYDFNDHLRLSFGRYHTDVSYYNMVYHSGRWLQTAVDRPLITAYTDDGGLLPTQAEGIQAQGLLPSGTLGLNYILEYGTPDTTRPDINGSAEINHENNSNHVLIGLYARPDHLPGLQIGGSYYHDRITDQDSPGVPRFGQTILNAHVIFTGHGIEFLNEGFLMRHARIGGPLLLNMPAFYTQFAKSFGVLRPYFRYQYINANPHSVYGDVLLRYGPSFGVRYDFNDNIAFKTQLDHTLRKGEPDLNGLQFQLAFTF
ncbi:MAG TPA: hypothetical protein VLW84_02270 [Terriglobales bacterium]|nr:hypothetical protein [Terriglobales bacterium]